MKQLNLSEEQYNIVIQSLKFSIKTSDWCMASDEIAEDLLKQLNKQNDPFRRFIEA